MMAAVMAIEIEIDLTEVLMAVAQTQELMVLVQAAALRVLVQTQELMAVAVPDVLSCVLMLTAERVAVQPSVAHTLVPQIAHL